MKCKCKNEMRQAGISRQEYDFSTEITEYFWCSNCGRLLCIGTTCSSFIDHNLIPKPRMVENDLINWCDCKQWKKSFSVNGPNEDSFCRYCGKQLTKTRMEEKNRHGSGKEPLVF